MRCSFGGVVGLDYTAMLKVADLYGIDVTSWEMDMIRAMEIDMLKKQNEDAAAERSKAESVNRKRR